MLALVILLCYFAVKALLSPGYFSMHDDQQVARLFELHKALTLGQFPVRWVDGLGFGYGYPLFNFYPPLVYYLGEIYHLILQAGFIDSIKLVWATALIGSAVSMYFLSKNFFGKLGGIVSAVFYLYHPYHAVDAYVRGALAELFSFVWLPLILLFSYKNKPILTGIFLGLLMVTHNLIFLPFVGIYILWSIAFKKNFIIPIIIGLGLSSFFWLPALLEKQFTLVDSILIKNLASYKIHFVCLSQLFYSPWGFGGSVAGCFDGLSFAMGKIYLLATGVALLVAIVKKSRVGLVSFLLLAISLFMTLPYSQFIWDKIPQLWYLQFPWRFLEFAALFSALLVGNLNKKIFAILLIPLVIFVNAKYFSPQTNYLDTTDERLISNQEIKWHVSSTSFEFMNGKVATKLNDKGAVWADINETQIQKSKIKIQKGDWETEKEDFKPDRFILVGRSQKGATIQFQISNFPGWKLWLDDKPKEFDDNNPYRLLSLNVPPGEHTIVGKFANTPVRTVGNTISILLGILLVFGAIKQKVYDKKS